VGGGGAGGSYVFFFLFGHAPLSLAGPQPTKKPTSGDFLNRTTPNGIVM